MNNKNIKDIKLGIIGLGSIGLRHVNELATLGVSKFYALRTNKGSKNIPEEVIKIVTNVYDKNEFINLNLDAYIISNPTSLHIDSINLVSKTNKPIFIEKPLFCDLSDLENLNKLNENIVQIGFCLRFHSLFQKVKELLDKNAIGNVYHSRLNVGQYLPTWHPYTDYRTEYFSKEQLGGGAIRTLSHEIDLAIYFFGLPIKSKSFSFKTSDLEIDVDDYSLVLLTYEANHTSRIEMDFISKKMERKGFIYGTKADLHYDLFNNKIEIFDTEGKLMNEFSVDENNMYSKQMKAFIDLITLEKVDKNSSTMKESITLTKIISNEKLI